MLDITVEEMTDQQRIVMLLKRNKVNTIGDLADNINKLRTFKNAGVKSVNAIKNVFFNFVIENMTESEVEGFIWDYIRKE